MYEPVVLLEQGDEASGRQEDRRSSEEVSQFQGVYYVQVPQERLGALSAYQASRAEQDNSQALQVRTLLRNDRMTKV